MKKLFIVGNWKMNLTLDEAGNLAKKLRYGMAELSSVVDVGVCPSFVYLKDVCEILQDSKICVGAQNMYLEESGAFTGEVSGAMIKDVGCTHVIIGHSERRTIFQETNSMINSKIKTALSCDAYLGGLCSYYGSSFKDLADKHHQQYEELLDSFLRTCE